MAGARREWLLGLAMVLVLGGVAAVTLALRGGDRTGASGVRSAPPRSEQAPDVGAPSTGTDALIARARRLRTTDPRAALRLLDEALAGAPAGGLGEREAGPRGRSDPAAVLSLRAEIRLDAGDYRGAIADHFAAHGVGQAPESTSRQSGQVGQDSRVRVDLLDIYVGALRQQPDGPFAQRIRAAIREAAGNVAGAASDLESGLATGAWWIDEWEQLASYYERMGDAGAAAMARGSVERTGSSGAGLAARASARATSGDVAAALADLDRAIRLAPGAAALHRDRGLLLQRLGRHAEALVDLEDCRIWAGAGEAALLGLAEPGLQPAPAKVALIAQVEDAIARSREALAGGFAVGSR